MKGEKVGTLFLLNSEPSACGSSEESPVKTSQIMVSDNKHTEEIAANAREGGRQLQALCSAERAVILEQIASSIHSKQADILAANDLDVRTAEAAGLTGLSPRKLSQPNQPVQE